MNKGDKYYKSEVSVVIPAYECEAYIEEAIQSVLGQIHKNIE